MEFQPPYPLRATFTGSLKFLCPWCGFVNTRRIDRTQWKVRCKAKKCRREFGYGLRLLSLGGLQGLGRRYAQPPDVTFPLTEFGFWEPGGTVHRHEVPEEATEE